MDGRNGIPDLPIAFRRATHRPGCDASGDPSLREEWNLTRADFAILLITTVFGYVIFNPTLFLSYLYPSPIAVLAPFISLALGLMLGVLILLILQRVSPHRSALSSQESPEA